MLRGRIILTSLVALFASQTALAEHQYLTIDGENLLVSGPFELTIPRPPGAKFANVQNSHTRFGMENLATSRGGFFVDDRILIIEVETTDAPAGTISYEGMPVVELAGLRLPSRSACLPLNKEQLEADDEPLIEFMNRIGFDPTPGMYGRQLLLTSKDGTGEVDALFAKRVKNCDEISEEEMAEFNAQFERFAQRVRDANPQADTTRFED